MILLVDIGNSNTKLKITGIDTIFSIQTSENYLSAYFELAVPEELKVPVEGAIISSVVPKASISLIEFIKKTYKVTPTIVNAGVRTNVVYPNVVHNEMGSDLICTMEGASLRAESFLVVDCGTATTFNLVVNNSYIGTAISPGMNTAHKALLKDAALIHYVDLNGPYQLLGLDTAQCVRSGTLNGTRFIVDGFISAIKEQYKLTNLKVFMTGGLSKLIEASLKNEVEYVKDLLFIGLEHIYKKNSEKK